MILWMYVILLSLSLVLLGLGYQYEAWSFQTISFFFLFILGLVLMQGQVTTQTGYNETMSYVYGNNLTGYHWDYNTTPPTCNAANPTDCVFLFHTYAAHVAIYEPLNDEWVLWFGRFLALGAAFGLIAFLFSLRASVKP